MIGAFEEAIINELNQDELKSKKYYGELINPKSFQFNQNELPIIYVDYIGDKPNDMLRKECKFNLYITHISYSKNEKTRQQKHQDIYATLKEIDERLALNSFCGSEPIKMGKTEKIFDAVVDSGYLTVYKREFTTILKTNE
ncbi:MAG: DUF1834 family protein [Arcobacteraceae bacterium]|jgi:hypothetical protein|nr:DUF1834 family protein [Arcobacteraceae bacterium]